ncbi:hypothetical protein CAAN1_11S01904 [[Candida] anglica]|uniref:SPIN90/Ldb17 leucine-rich domain-containing protein n=1 Tax=[Candida] anglica TaxID=148631 RepID=A0ABP0EI49_9ASCO
MTSTAGRSIPDAGGSGGNDGATRGYSNVPITSFPGFPNAKLPQHADSVTFSLNERLQPLLVNSDALECNNNLSCFLKDAVDGLYGISDDPSTPNVPQKNYQMISSFALKLIKSNLFTRNHRLCLGKILGLLAVLTENDIQPSYSSGCLKEFLCIVMLLVVKTASSENSPCNQEQLIEVLRELNFAKIIFEFLSVHIKNFNAATAPYIILKFGCDIVFEYLYRVEILSDNEFKSLAMETSLISTLISDLLKNDNFNNYDLDDDEDWDDENKVIAYEEFKLVLLINEQYLMKSYTMPGLENRVFLGLMNVSDTSGQPNQTSQVSGFINMVICYLNREESQIIKILILKFLYLIFTTSYTTKLFYLNDLKILVDIFIRELNNLDCSEDNGVANENRILTITYLRVMYPLLMFSQLSELESGYKNNEIVNLLGHLIVNSEPRSSDGESSMQKSIQEQEEVITNLAIKCLKLPSLKKTRRTSSSTSPTMKHVRSATVPAPVPGSVPEPSAKRPSPSSLTSSPASSTSSLTTSSSFRKTRPDLYQRGENISQESIGAAFTRVASVRASTRKDFHRNTTTHNLEGSKVTKRNAFMDNNNNIFQSETGLSSLSLDDDQNILNLPKEYLGDIKSQSNISKPTPSPSPSPSPSIGSRLIRKALIKKAPPPPPHAHSPIHHRNLLQHEESKDSPTPPPPPPPRRRR